jgi:hypothetical protein
MGGRTIHHTFRRASAFAGGGAWRWVVVQYTSHFVVHMRSQVEVRGFRTELRDTSDRLLTWASAARDGIERVEARLE